MREELHGFRQMGRITQRTSNKNEHVKSKRKHRKKDLDNLHSRVLKTKRKLINVAENIHKDHCNKSKIANKHVRAVYAGIFRNGTKGKNVKKGKCENVVSRARLVGDALKLFDGESETICASEDTTGEESIKQLSSTQLVNNISERRLHVQEGSPVLGRKLSKTRMEDLEDLSKKNKETEIVFDPIDIPEVVINYNPSKTKRTTRKKEKNKEKKGVTSLDHNASSSSDLYDHYTKLGVKISDEFKNVLNHMEDPLSVAQGKLKRISSISEVKCTQHDADRRSPNSKLPDLFVSEYQACSNSNNSELLQSSVAQFPENQNGISCSSGGQHIKKNLYSFFIDQVDSNLRRNERYFDISILPNDSKLPLKKRLLITTPREKLPTQPNNEQINIVDYCDESSAASHKYSTAVRRSERSNEAEFSEQDFVNMFQNLTTPSTVNRKFGRSKVPEDRIEPKASRPKKFEGFITDLPRTNSSNRENERQFRNYSRSQGTLEVLTAAAAFVEGHRPPQAEVEHLSTGRYASASSNWCNPPPGRRSLSFHSSHDAGPSSFNLRLPKQHGISRNAPRCEERQVCLGCSKRSHESHVSQVHQSHPETSLATVAPGCSYFPMRCSSDANNCVNLPNNVGYTRMLPLVSNRDPCTYQVDNHHHMVCLQNFTQPVKYFALDGDVNVRKIPVYVNDDVRQCRDHENCSAVVFCNKRECSSVNLARCHNV